MDHTKLQFVGMADGKFVTTTGNHLYTIGCHSTGTAVQIAI